ncbi:MULTISPECIES: VCBS repeat-containing protein [Actinosynnema]|uniref:FG-GAP repeat domain-containing protein n=1 Tax=Actinosynnema TaxID=40566 RepID=UPI0020A2D886|nr:VCBS repeat-containing protein [Actinosynnema pretiosum]MCP2098809.1 Repeat domain-containing protein [Actinosynnema pretiosum]
MQFRRKIITAFSALLLTATTALGGAVAHADPRAQEQVGAPPSATALPGLGPQITRAEVLARAQRWVDQEVLYSQDQTKAVDDGDGHKYRPDCSGYVSMAWHLPKKTDGWDLNTGDFATWSGKTFLGSYDELKPGDALLSSGHMVLFDKWADAGRTEMWIYQERTWGDVAQHVKRSRSSYEADDFRALRYLNIVDSTPVVNGETQVRGDFTGDGKDDLVMLYDYPGARSVAFVARSTGTSFDWPASWWDSGAGTWEAGRSKLSVGDVNGDGKDDLILLYDYPGARTVAFVARSTGSSFEWPVSWWDSGAGTWEAGRSRPVVGDVTGDGKADLVMLYDYPNARTVAFVGRSTGTSFEWPASWWDSGAGTWEAGRTKLSIGDTTGDGKADLVMLYDYPNGRTAAFVARSTGTSFEWPAFWWDSGNGTWEAGRSKLSVGDTTGDGKDDVVILYDYPGGRTAAFVARSTGTSFDWPASWWDSGAGMWEAGRTKLVLGDHTGDGLVDATLLYDYPGARTTAFVARSTGTALVWPLAWWDSGAGAWEWGRSRVA